MKTKIRWITETAVMLALLVSLQAITKPLGQLVTGSCVNAVLVVATLTAGVWSGVAVALLGALIFIIPDKAFSEQENRALQQRPQLQSKYSGCLFSENSGCCINNRHDTP